MTKRLFDFFFSLFLLLLFFPLFVLLSLIIVIDSPGGIFFLHTRMGLHGKPFRLFKFRTMRKDAAKGMPITTHNDNRITRVGKWLRKYKLDELPQLLNVLLGEMSLVGPRPEVPDYAAFYTGKYEKVLQVKPGITDEASLLFIDENELLKGDDPEEIYKTRILPAKLELALQYTEKQNLFLDFQILWRTAKKSFFR
ncbi:MAG: sugar transferase [Bacteroidota bacterium]|jgi:lipopolysaccharide/colanic/teichoic acid biosynthesis glycosyltransferase